MTARRPEEAGTKKGKKEIGKAFAISFRQRSWLEEKKEKKRPIRVLNGR